MAIIFDEVTADITPPPPTGGTEEPRSDPPDASRRDPDPRVLIRQLQLIAERAQRLHAD